MKRRSMFTGRGWLAIGFILCALAGAAAGIILYIRVGSSTTGESEAVAPPEAIALDDSIPSVVAIPEWINELPPEDAFWGIGNSKLEDESLALEAAVSDARWDIAAQFSMLIQSMVTEYISEEGTLIREIVTREAVTNIDLSGAVINAQERTADGTWWVRVSLQKADAMKARNAELKTREALKMLDAELEKAQQESRSGD